VRESLGLIRDSYLKLDPRVLGVFRIALGAVLLYDVARRFPDAGLLWSDDGVLSGETLRRVPQATHQLSFLFALKSAQQVALGFLGLGVVFLLYGLGLFTRVVQPLALLGYASLNARNLFFEDGGTGTVIILLTWTLLLPLGRRYSLDAVWRDGRLPNTAARVRARRAAAQPVITLAALGLLLQAAVIYWFNAVHKSGATWRGGDAVHLVLWQHRVNTPFALWFSAHEPTWFSPVMSWATKRLEYLLPVLLLWPTHTARTRPVAFALAALLHGGIALCLTLGPFSYAMICLVWASVPGEAFEELAIAVRRPLRPLWLRLARLRARAVRAGAPRKRPVPRSRVPSGVWTKLREASLVFVFLVESVSVLASNRAVPKWLQVSSGPWVDAYKPYLRGYQSWSMFAPDAPREDGTMVFDAVTADGRHVDPFTGGEPQWDQIRMGLAPHSIALSDYFLAMRAKGNSRYLRDLARYLRSLPTDSAAQRLRSVDVWWVSYQPPARGQRVPGETQRKHLWRTRL
jgi:Vitamin K-dependent gamma-carboxylase